MSAKNLLLMGIALAAAVALWIAAEIASGGTDRLEQAELFGAIAADAIDSAVVAGVDDTVRLVRTPFGGWEVNGFAAVSEAGMQLSDALASARRGQLVARSRASHERMGVDSASAVRVRAFERANATVDVFVGERGRGFRTVYVRPAGAEAVYLVEGELAGLIDRSVADWRDKRITTLDPATVSRVTVERADVAYALTRGPDGWAVSDGSAADSQRVVQLLEEFRSLAAQGAGFATTAQADSADFDRPDRTVTLLGDPGDTLAALVFDSTDAGCWVRHRSGGTVYLLYGWKVEALTPADSVFR